MGARRDEETFHPEIYMNTLPDDVDGADVIVLDPMLATGGSLLHALRVIAASGAGTITAVVFLLPLKEFLLLNQAVLMDNFSLVLLMTA